MTTLLMALTVASVAWEIGRTPLAPAMNVQRVFRGTPTS